jgi:hypothetical protein
MRKYGGKAYTILCVSYADIHKTFYNVLFISRFKNSKETYYIASLRGRNYFDE